MTLRDEYMLHKRDEELMYPFENEEADEETERDPYCCSGCGHCERGIERFYRNRIGDILCFECMAEFILDDHYDTGEYEVLE